MYPDRFALMQTQKQPELQPDCPIYIHCTRRCRDKASGAVFLQVRMVNRSDSLVETVILRGEGLDAQGETVYTMKELILANCNAQPRSIFGENKILAIDPAPVERVRMTVERVIFSSGMIWRRMPGQGLVPGEKTLWKTCKCGMRNPPKQAHCELCGRAFVQPVPGLDHMPSPGEEDFPEIPPISLTRPPESCQGPGSLPPAAVLSPDQTGEEKGRRGLRVLLYILTAMALLSLVALIAWCIVQYRQNVL